MKNRRGFLRSLVAVPLAGFAIVRHPVRHYHFRVHGVGLTEPTQSRGLYVGKGGKLVIRIQGCDEEVIYNAEDGTVLPLMNCEILRGTTCKGIVWLT
ncbi:MAG: hypothetical protein O7D91_21465 [Planctomycetota bacterium]|nr:hypothetical protein [Planctomycetota bacterium]